MFVCFSLRQQQQQQQQKTKMKIRTRSIAFFWIVSLPILLLFLLSGDRSVSAFFFFFWALILYDSDRFEIVFKMFNFWLRSMIGLKILSLRTVIHVTDQNLFVYFCCGWIWFNKLMCTSIFLYICLYMHLSALALLLRETN